MRLCPEDIKKTIRQLEKEKELIRKKKSEFVAKIAMEIYKEIRNNLGSISAKEEEARGINVTAEKTETDHYRIVAQGENIAFIEFGAGTAVKPQVLKDSNGGMIPNYPGAWSEDHSRQFVDNGYWYHNGRQYTFKVSYAPVHFAVTYVRANIQKIAREIFND